MDALDILEQLERVKGLNQKKKVLSKHLENQEFKDLIEYSLSFDKKFYIKKYELYDPKTKPLENAHKKFIDLLEVLNARSVTGTAAIDAVEWFLHQCNAKQQKWYDRVLKKDLRCNISVKTANASGFNIPVFDVMLATDGHKCKKIESVLNSGAFVSPKMDGYRCVAIKKGKDVALYSRNGTYYGNFPSIVEILEKIPGDFVLDGEIMSDNFQSMQRSAFASTRGTVVGDVEYHVFGMIPIEEWESEDFQSTTGKRLALLNNWFNEHKPDKLILVNQEPVTTLDEVLTLESKYIQDGYEGAMVLPNIPYYKGRKANALMKFKRTESMDVKIIGVYEGTGKYMGSLGGLTVLQDNSEVCDVGSGFTDAERKWIWENKESVLDRTAEIQYQEMTPDNIMRFPIFLRWRDLGIGTDKV